MYLASNEPHQSHNPKQDKQAPAKVKHFTVDISDNEPVSGASCNRHLNCAYQPDGKPLCNMQSQEYLKGQWERVLPLPKQDQTSRSFIARELDRYAYNYQDMCNSATTWECHVAEPNQCRTKSLRILAWQWIPQKCSLYNFDAVALDRVLAGKTVLFFGDSLMRQMFNSWRMLIRDVWLNREEALNNVRQDAFHTKSGTEYAFHWSKYMVDEGPLVDGGDLMIDDKYGWSGYLQSHPDKVDYVVFNVGHHWHKNDEEFEKYNTMVEMTMKKLKQHFRGSKIIFRTSTPGHYNCDRDDSLHQQPIDYIPNLDAEPEKDKYNWRTPVKADLVWQQFAHEMEMQDTFMYLNVSMSGYRSDAHVEWNVRKKKQTDCLHWCQPGVPDMWNHLLFNVLMQQDS